MGNKANTVSEELKADEKPGPAGLSELLDSALPETRLSPVFPVPQANICIHSWLALLAPHPKSP